MGFLTLAGRKRGARRGFLISLITSENTKPIRGTLRRKKMRRAKKK
jgi:hypothetical protein